MREPGSATAWVVVPREGSPSVLVLPGVKPMLPVVTFDGHRVPTDTSLSRMLRTTLGIDARLVRFLDILGTFGPDVVALVAPIPAAAAPRGTRWLGRSEAKGLDRHAAVVERWFAETDGRPPPRQRVPWYRPGWFETTTAWVDAALAALGHRRTGPLVRVSHTPYSAVSRLVSSMGELYLKATEPEEHHSALVAGLLSGRMSGRVPAVVAIDAARGWWLSLAVREDPTKRTANTLEAATGVLAEVQLASAAWVPELSAAGCPDMTLEVLARDAPALITADPVVDVIDPDDRPLLADAACRVPAWCRTAAAAGVPVCLQHGDFGLHNVVVGRGGPVLLDWRGWLGDPFADSHLMLQNVGDPVRRRSAWSAYLRPWSAVLPPTRLDEAASAMEPVFNAQYLVQVARRAVAVAADPDAYEPWTRPQLAHNLRWFAGRLLRSALDERSPG